MLVLMILFFFSIINSKKNLLLISEELAKKEEEPDQTNRITSPEQKLQRITASIIGLLCIIFILYINFAVIGTVFYCMNHLGINTSTLLASAGLLTLIVGLGAQALVGDIIAGVFNVFESEFHVGDVITIGDWRGTVLEIGIRTTKVEDANQNIKIFNNAEIKGVINMTQHYSFVICDIGIDYNESLEYVENVLERELPLIANHIPEIENGPYYKGVVSLGDSSVVIRILAQCQEADSIQLKRDLNRELKLVFDRNNINIPFPQVVLHQASEVADKERTSMEHVDHEAAKRFIESQKEASKDMFYH